MSERYPVRLTSKLLSIVSREPAELVERHRRLDPIRYPMLHKNSYDQYFLGDETVQVKLVGSIIQFPIIKMYDAMPYAVWWDMTRRNYLDKDFDANAIYLIPQSRENIDEWHYSMEYQPLHIASRFDPEPTGVLQPKPTTPPSLNSGAEVPLPIG